MDATAEYYDEATNENLPCEGTAQYCQNIVCASLFGITCTQWHGFFAATSCCVITMIQMSEIKFFDANGVVIPPLAVFNPGGNSPGGQESSKITDGNLDTKWLDYNILPLVFEFALSDARQVSWRWATGGDAPERDPIDYSWEYSESCAVDDDDLPCDPTSICPANMVLDSSGYYYDENDQMIKYCSDPYATSSLAVTGASCAEPHYFFFSKGCCDYAQPCTACTWTLWSSDVGVIPTSDRNAWNPAIFFPTDAPTASPTAAPTAAPTAGPTNIGDTHAPTASPTATPTDSPTDAPSDAPTDAPTAAPTDTPTDAPTVPTAAPTDTPTAAPTPAPTNEGDTHAPTSAPTATPTGAPTAVPTAAPTAAPTAVPTSAPTATPTDTPTAVPTAAPTTPTSTPTSAPSAAPTAFPTNADDIDNWIQLLHRCTNSTCSSASGCTLYLGNGFVMGDYNSSLDFSGKNITLWGNGKILDPLGEGRMFWGSGAGSSLTLHEFVLQNGGGGNSWSPTRDEGGGAIHARDGTRVEIYDCIFRHNAAGLLVKGFRSPQAEWLAQSRATLYNAGGAIYAQGADVEIYTSTFEHNKVGFASGKDDFFAGGAVYVCNGTNLQIHDTTFQLNGKANLARCSKCTDLVGGAILARDGGIVTIYNSTFLLNVANVAGAVYASTNVEVKLHACSFYQNGGEDSLSAMDQQLWFYDANVEIHDTTFDYTSRGWDKPVDQNDRNNHGVYAEKSVVEIHASRSFSGLAIYALEATVNIHNTTSSWSSHSPWMHKFVRIYQRGASTIGQIYAEASNLTIRNSVFEVLGGGIFAQDLGFYVNTQFIDIQGGSNLEIYASEFKNDISSMSFIKAVHTNVTIYTTSFIVAQPNAADIGSILCAAGSVEIHNSTFQSTGFFTTLLALRGVHAIIHNSEFSSIPWNMLQLERLERLDPDGTQRGSWNSDRLYQAIEISDHNPMQNLHYSNSDDPGKMLELYWDRGPESIKGTLEIYGSTFQGFQTAVHAASKGATGYNVWQGCGYSGGCAGYSVEIHDSVFNVSGGSAVAATNDNPDPTVAKKVRIYDTTLISTTPTNNFISSDMLEELDILLVQVFLSWIGPFSEGIACRVLLPEI
jgi:hypothetical protein